MPFLSEFHHAKQRLSIQNQSVYDMGEKFPTYSIKTFYLNSVTESFNRSKVIPFVLWWGLPATNVSFR